MSIGVNWAEIWKPVWALVWEQGSAPAPSPAPSQTPAGKPRKRPRRERYIASYKGREYEFDALGEVEALVESVKAEQAAIPKKKRAPVKISLTPEFLEEAEQYIDVPFRMSEMPASAALAQARRIEQAIRTPHDDSEDEEIILWLM